MASYEAKCLNLKEWAKLTGPYRAESSARHQTQERGRLVESNVFKSEKIKGPLDVIGFFISEFNSGNRIGQVIISEFFSMSRPRIASLKIYTKLSCPLASQPLKYQGYISHEART